jgi:hypothetical protein
VRRFKNVGAWVRDVVLGEVVKPDNRVRAHSLMAPGPAAGGLVKRADGPVLDRHVSIDR